LEVKLFGVFWQLPRCKREAKLLGGYSFFSSNENYGTLTSAFCKYGIVSAAFREQKSGASKTNMAINFSDKVLVTNPTTYNLGRGVLCAGIVAILVGIVTHFTGDVLIPALGWCAFGVPTIVIGGIFMTNGLTKR
jgi:hypothetical protein